MKLNLMLFIAQHKLKNGGQNEYQRVAKKNENEKLMEWWYRLRNGRHSKVENKNNMENSTSKKIRQTQF